MKSGQSETAGVSLPPRGDFGHRTVVGAFEPDLEGALHTRTYFGLPNYCTWIYGLLRDAEGRLFNFARTVYGLEVSIQSFFNTNLAGGQLRAFVPERAEDRFAFGGLSCRIEGGEHRMESLPSTQMFELGSSGATFAFRRTVDACHYAEGDVLRVSGARVGPGLQIYVASASTPFFHCSLLHRVEGHFLDTAVQGFCFFDQLFLPPGVSWTTGPYINSGVNTIELAWNPFANEYADGTIEWGHLTYGAEGFCFALVADRDGPVLLSNDVTLAKIAYKDSGFPSDVVYLVDDREEWRWEPDPHGELVDHAGGSSLYRAAEGRMHRVGDDRQPVTWTSWQSSYPESIRAWRERRGPWAHVGPGYR